MGVYTMLTDTGLSEIAQAQPETGMLIDITYWVAAYDNQLDIDYKSGSPDATDISNYTSTTDTYPFQNNQDPNNITYWKSDPVTSATPDTTDVYPGVAYGPAVESEKVTYLGDWNPNGSNTIPIDIDGYPSNRVKGNYWNVLSSGVVGDITYDVGDTLLFNGSIFTNAVGDNVRGNFRVTVGDSTKDMKVNKVCLYAVRRSIDGAILANPFMIGQVIIPNTQLLVASETGAVSSDQIIVDFQIDAQAAIKNFTNILYASQDDYWSRATNSNGQFGLQYDGSIFITNRLGTEDQNYNFNDDTNVGVAKTLIATYQTVNKPDKDEEASLPQLALQYVKSDNYNQAVGSAFSPRIRTTFRTTSTGDCEVDMYGACDNKYGMYAITPKTDRLIGIGNNEHRWKSLKTSDRIESYLGDAYTTGTLTDVVNVSGAVIPAGGYVKIVSVVDGVVNVAQATSSTNTIGFTSSEIGISGKGTITTRRDSRWDYIKTDAVNGYMVLKNNDMSSNDRSGMGYFGNSSLFVGPHFDDREAVDTRNNYYYTYGNISNYHSVIKKLDGTTSRVSFDLAMRSTNDCALFNISEDYMSPKELGAGYGVDAQSTVWEIGNMIYNGKRDMSVDEKTYVQAIVQGKTYTNAPIDTSIFKKFYTYDKWTKDVASGGLDNGINFSTVDQLRQSIYGTTGSGDTQSTTDNNGINKDVILASSRYIFANGDIVPMIDKFNNIGTDGQRYRGLYAGTLYGAKQSQSSVVVDGEVYYDYSGWNLLKVDADIVPKSSTNKITRNPDSGDRFEYINCDILGGLYSDSRKSYDFIDAGYISNIHSHKIRTGTLDADNVYVTNGITANTIKTGNIFVETINGLPYSEYLNTDRLITESYALDINSGVYRIIRASTEIQESNYSFRITVSGVVNVIDKKLTSCTITVGGGDLIARTGSVNWEPEDWVVLFRTSVGDLKALLDAQFGADIVDASDFKHTVSNAVSVGAEDKQVRDHGTCDMTFTPTGDGVVGEPFNLRWSMQWDDYTWSDWSKAWNDGTITLDII